MSLAYFIVLDNQEPGFDTFVNGKDFAHCETLEEITQKLGIADIYSYVDGDAEALFGEGGDEYDEDEENWPPFDPSKYVWFDPAEGISYFGTLKAYFENDGATTPNAEGISEDLGEFISVLEQAAAIGAKWHLQIDI